MTNSNVLVWESGDSPCMTAEFSAEEIQIGECGGTLKSVSSDITNHTQGLRDLTERYASFNADTRAGSVTFSGRGALVATDAEQRAIAEWAKLNFETAQAGRAGVSWGMAFAWHRSGGFAGMCNEVTVYLTGWVAVSDCREGGGGTSLTTSQLEQLYGWVDSLAPFERTEKPGAHTADIPTMGIAFNGLGTEEVDDETLRLIYLFASDLLTQVTFDLSAPPGKHEAVEALRDYFVALNSGDYIVGAKLYGGGTGLLETWNPDITSNLPKMLERGCTQNGLMCLLPRSITYRGPDSGGGFQFRVEFSNADGTLFRQGPCCGETEGAPVTIFTFRVMLTVSGYLVMDLPPYMP